ncbi:MAG: polysaccharide biosynthesis/export family protein [Pirellulales bacterium]
MLALGKMGAVLAGLCLATAGCRCPQPGGMVWAPDKTCLDPMVPAPPADMPRELNKVSLPEYVIEPPDILRIDAIKVVPKAPYEIQTLDMLNVSAVDAGGAADATYRINVFDRLSIEVANTLPDQPIRGEYQVGPGGFLNLGFDYGTVRVAGMTLVQAQEAVRTHLLDSLNEPLVVQFSLAGTGSIQGVFAIEPGGQINLGVPYGMVTVAGMTLEQATEAIERHLGQYMREPQVTLSLVQTAGEQQISGEHLVGPDGHVTLGSYGKVYVTGMSQQQAREAIEDHLSRFLEDPEVGVDIYAYNSKVYYIVTAGAGLGDGVARFPITGNETVLDAIAQINGLESVSSKRIWIARPAPYGAGCDQILPVDWHGITQRANTSTNYQLLPGDRLFVDADRLVSADTFISKLTAPAERVFGFALLGGRSVQFYRFFHRGNQFGGFGGGGGF